MPPDILPVFCTFILLDIGNKTGLIKPRKRDGHAVLYHFQGAGAVTGCSVQQCLTSATAYTERDSH